MHAFCVVVLLWQLPTLKGYDREYFCIIKICCISWIYEVYKLNSCCFVDVIWSWIIGGCAVFIILNYSGVFYSVFVVYPRCDNVFYLCHRFRHVVLNVTLFGDVHSCTLFTIVIDLLLAEFVCCKIAILNGCIEYKRGFFFNTEGILVQLSCTWNWNQPNGTSSAFYLLLFVSCYNRRFIDQSRDYCSVHFQARLHGPF